MAGSNSNDLLRHSSYVQQGGYLVKKTLFGLQKKRRYVRLDGSAFQIWKSEEDWKLRIPESNDVPALTPISEIGVQNCTITGNSKQLEIEIIAPHRTETFYAENLDAYNSWYNVLKDASEKTIKDYYKFVKVLGQGAFGRVLLAKDKRTMESFAVKVIRKSKNNLQNSTMIQREIDILRLVNHPNAVRLYDLFDTDTRYYLVLEYMRGGVLLELVSKSQTEFTEERASIILKDVLKGLEHLHSLNIVHRDVKPENVLTTSPEWPFTSKVADFGLSDFLENNTGVLESQVGTPYYAAREIRVVGKYGTKADLWSVGVMAYEMLSGCRPFEGDTKEEVLEALDIGTYKFQPDKWDQISSEARDFVEKLICINVDKRMSATNALQHPWIANEGRRAVITNDFSRIRQGFEEGRHMNEESSSSDEEMDKEN